MEFIKLSIDAEEVRGRKKSQDPQNTGEKWCTCFLPWLSTLRVTGLNAPVKRQRWSYWG